MTEFDEDGDPITRKKILLSHLTDGGANDEEEDREDPPQPLSNG